MRKTWTKLSLVVFSLLALALPGAAQTSAATGAIAGKVTDESGAAMPGVAVTIENVATGVDRSAITDGAGRYLAPLLPVGSYRVTAELQGFAKVQREGLRVGIGETISADLTLKIAGVEETIVVTAEAPLLEASRTSQASAVSEKEVANLPVNGRNFIDFVLTTPGVVRDTRGGDISFAGQRGTLNSLVIDGADNNNTFFGQTLGRTGSGRAPYQFSQDAVQEFQVNRNAYSAEYGRAGGAVINVVTKSGTNDFHGSLFDFYRDDSLNANSYLNKINNRDKLPFHVDQYGGSLGGPVVQDKIFFFLSYDAQRQEIPNPVVLNLPSNLPNDAATQAGVAILRSKAGSYSLTRDQDVYLAKIDAQLNSAHRLSFRYNQQDFTGANNENSGSTSALEHTGSSDVLTKTANLSLASVFGGSLFNELRAQWAKDQEPGAANSNLPEVTVRQGGVTLLVFGRNFFSPRETTIDRWQAADTVSLAKGAHTFKAGFDVNQDDIFNFFPGNFGGRYTFNSIASLGNGIPNGSGESYQQAFAGAGTSGPTTHPNLIEYALFAQDEWQLRDDLTLTLGLRYDLEKYDQPQVRNPDAQLAAAGIDTSSIPRDNNNVAPRLGLSWSPNAKTVFRGGYGVFYGRTPAIMVGTAHSGNGINVVTYTFTGSQVPKFPNVLTSPPSGATAPKPSISVFANDYENPRVQQASLGFERELSNDLAFAASYLYVRGDHLQRSRDGNIGTPVATQVPVQGGGSVTIQQFPTARPFANFDRIIFFESTAKSEYNGLTLELRKRFGGRFQGNLAYTLSKVEDTNPDATNVVLGGGDDARFPSNPVDFNVDKAPGNNDARHRLVFSGLWDLGYWQDAAGAKKALLDGWSLSWIASYQSGIPYSQRIANDVNRDGNRANDLVPGKRNSERLPDYTNVDLRISRRIALHGPVKLELLAEAFNLFDSTVINQRQGTLYNFTNGVLVPQTNLSNPRLNFGADQNAAPERIVQLAAKITF